MTLEQVQRCGRYVGRNEMIAHLSGKHLSYKKMAMAKCFECMGGYADGGNDCRIPACALYRTMPYRGQTAGLCLPGPLKPPPPAMDGGRNEGRATDDQK